MKRGAAILAFLALGAAVFGSTLLRIAHPGEATLKAILPHVREWVGDSFGDSLDVIVDDNASAALDAIGTRFRIVQSETGAHRDIAGFHNYAQVVTELQNLAATYPAITSLTSLGPSTGNLYFQAGHTGYANYQHQIWCMKVSDNPAVEEDEPNVYFTGTIHAREPLGVEITLNLLNYLLANYGTDPQVTAWIDSQQIWFIPLINPDGHRVVTSQTYTMFRKNLRDNNGSWAFESGTDGVDLNRNFGVVWGNYNASSSPYDDTYHGPAAWSEIETCYLRDFIRAHKFWGGITYHSYGQQVLYPLGHVPGANSYDGPVMSNLAIRMANATAGQYGGVYSAMQAGLSSCCQGTMGDWGYAEQRLFSFTLETATAFIPAASYVPQIVAANMPGALMFLDRTSNSLVTGHVTDPSGSPLVAEVRVAEIDNATGMTAVEPVRSGAAFGHYWRMLLPGNYTVTFSKTGYLSQTFNNVVVSATTPTTLDVTLQPICPSPPANLVIVIADGQVQLSWDPVTTNNNGAPITISRYRVYAATSLDGPWTESLSTTQTLCVLDMPTDDQRLYRITAE
jgi:carboxypeptidase T